MITSTHNFWGAALLVVFGRLGFFCLEVFGFAGSIVSYLLFGILLCVGIMSAAVSHFVLDCIPHIDLDGWQYLKESPRVKGTIITFEITAGIVFLYWVFSWSPSQIIVLGIAGAVLGNLVDMVDEWIPELCAFFGYHISQTNRFLIWLRKKHSAWHQATQSMGTGIASQVGSIILGAIILILCTIF